MILYAYSILTTLVIFGFIYHWYKQKKPATVRLTLQEAEQQATEMIVFDDEYGGGKKQGAIDRFYPDLVEYCHSQGLQKVKRLSTLKKALRPTNDKVHDRQLVILIFRKFGKRLVIVD